MLSDSDRTLLLRIARDTIRATLSGTPPPHVTVESPALGETRGAFVTLKSRGRLRGCIGTFAADEPLWRTVQRMAGAALRDPRFLSNPVTLRELEDLELEISALTPLEPVENPLEEIELGRHGISIESPFGAGCFLPQVADETGWTIEEFLSHCAAGKAGLPPDAWARPDVTVYRFEAEVFGEASPTR